MANKKVFIDLGHGGNDPGACGNGLRESDIVLSVGLRVKYHVQRHNVDVMLSRESDKTVSLAERTDMANRWGADAFLSIHCNSAASIAAYGIETFCYQFRYIALANKVHARLLEDGTLYYTNRGVKEGNFHVVRESSMPACLVEMAFISNERDAQLLINRQEQYAIAMAKGLLDYLGIAWRDETVTPPSQPNGEIYRVRKSWSDSASQKSANNVLEYAIAECKKHPGYSVFNSKGVAVYTNGGAPTPAPKPPKPSKPSKTKVDVFYKFDNLPWVKNLQDDAGLRGVSARNLYAYPSRGEVLFRVAAVNKGYYPWVQNYKTPSGHYDFAGNGVPIDRIQMKLRGLSGYSIRYRVRLVDGTLLPWVTNCNDINSDGYAGIRGRAISNIEMEII